MKKKEAEFLTEEEAQAMLRVPDCKNALWELGRDYFEALYRRASGREETILLTLAKAKTDLSITDSAKRVGAAHKDFPLKNVKHFLYRLAWIPTEADLLTKSCRKGSEWANPPQMMLAYC